MSQSLSSSATTVDLAAFEGFECSLRSDPVNFKQIQINAVKLFGDLPTCVGFALKLNLHGLRIKTDDFIIIKGTKTMLMDLVKKIREQPGYAANGDKEGASIKIGKTLVTPTRIARAFAADTIRLIKAGKVSVPDDLLGFGKDGDGNQATANHFCFLNAAYGMKDKEITDNMSSLVLFATKFDTAIAVAYKQGWIQGDAKRSHVEALGNYIQFRGIDLA